MIIFYHSADLDGHASGAIVKYANPEAELFGINYGDEFPWDKVAGQEVVMVDYSLQPWEDMRRLALTAKSLLWIDHHKTAINEFELDGFPKLTNVQSYLDSNFAACELTWEYYFGNPIPKSIFWLGRYDIWKHFENPGSLEFQYGIRLQDTWPQNQVLWENIFNSEAFAEQVRAEGELILRYETEQNKKFAKSFAFETELDGLRCIALNKGFSNSLVFDSVYDPEKHDAMLSFCWRGGRWNISLYSTNPNIDVSAICKARGGGGHKGAAGYQTQELNFLTTVNSRGNT